ncbi:MAG: DUF3577 domain-containing protein [Rhodocyclaceae bacterium]|nr:DUF3577 domain-containing protein [Rhodocyclaceae bacterium]
MNQPQQKPYFDLHVQGVGYINRIRTVTPKKGAPFLACAISAIRGDAQDAERVSFDVKVVGKDAQKVITGLEADVRARKRVLVGFKIGDPWVDSFTYEKDFVAQFDTKSHKKGDTVHKKGDTGFMLKGRLLLIRWVKVDGQDVDLGRYGVEAPQPLQDAA